MAVRTWSKDHQKVKELVQNYGCIEKNQVSKLFPNLDPPEKAYKNILYNLLKARQLEMIDSRYVVPLGKQLKPKRIQAADCMWAMLRVAKSPEDIFSSLPAREPAFSYMCVDHQKSYEFFYCDSDDVLFFNALKDRMAEYSQKPGEPVKCVLVTANRELLKAIKEMDFPADLYIIIISHHEGESEPDVEVKKKTADTEEVRRQKEEHKQLLNAFANSGKTLQEVLDFLAG